MLYPLRSDRIWSQNEEKPLAALKRASDFVVPLRRARNVGGAIPIFDVTRFEDSCKLFDKTTVLAGVREKYSALRGPPTRVHANLRHFLQSAGDRLADFCRAFARFKFSKLAKDPRDFGGPAHLNGKKAAFEFWVTHRIFDFASDAF